jgi:hypothetical protein
LNFKPTLICKIKVVVRLMWKGVMNCKIKFNMFFLAEAHYLKYVRPSQTNVVYSDEGCGFNLH